MLMTERTVTNTAELNRAFEDERIFSVLVEYNDGTETEQYIPSIDTDEAWDCIVAGLGRYFKDSYETTEDFIEELKKILSLYDECEITVIYLKK